jgi:hypothetical protein
MPSVRNPSSWTAPVTGYSEVDGALGSEIALKRARTPYRRAPSASR